MIDRDTLRKQILESIDELDDWQLELLARAARPLSASTGFGIASYLLELRTVRPEGDRVVGEIDISTLHLNPHGVAHGMIAFGILDNAMGQAAYHLVPERRDCVAVELKIHFARGITPGRIRVEARLVHAGGRIAVTEGRLFDEQGQLCTLATGTYYRMSGERTEKRRATRAT